MSLLIILTFNWEVSAISISLMAISVLFVKRTSYTQMVTFSIFSAVLFSYFLLNFFINYEIANPLFLAIFCLISMCVLTIQGIFENNLEKFLIYSNIIQVLFVVLDLIVAKMAGKISTPLATIQIFNYTFAGLLLFLTLGILSKDNIRTKISSLRGSFYRNKITTICASIAAISLAGVPGLNMFVSEWLLFKTSFAISPVITIFGIFLALLLFVMYFKIVYVLMSGGTKAKERSPIVLNWLNIFLTIACLLFGLMPQIQFLILNSVV